MKALKQIINELDSIEASAAIVVERCQRLRRELGPVSTGASKKKAALSEDKKAKILGNKRRTILRIAK